jgi:glutamine amidotransferase
MTIGIVDYGMGNRRSVEKALAHVGARVLLSGDPDRLREADGLIVPGVGAFPEAMRRLRERGLDELIRERFAAGTPMLGICLGMQLAFERSSELGGAEGLGLVPGEVRELRAGSLKLPHIGWNPVHWETGSPLIADLPQDCPFYHVHSFVAAPEEHVLGTAEYGERFVTAVARESFWGVQFHPEKSSSAGLGMLRNFAAICSRVAA